MGTALTCMIPPEYLYDTPIQGRIYLSYSSCMHAYYVYHTYIRRDRSNVKRGIRPCMIFIHLTFIGYLPVCIRKFPSTSRRKRNGIVPQSQLLLMFASAYTPPGRELSCFGSSFIIATYLDDGLQVVCGTHGPRTKQTAHHQRFPEEVMVVLRMTNTNKNSKTRHSKCKSSSKGTNWYDWLNYMIVSKVSPAKVEVASAKRVILKGTTSKMTDTTSDTTTNRCICVWGCDRQG